MVGGLRQGKMLFDLFAIMSTSSHNTDISGITNNGWKDMGLNDSNLLFGMMGVGTILIGFAIAVFIKYPSKPRIEDELVAFKATSAFSRVVSNAPRQYQYFDNVEVYEGVAVVRFNGPGKMNTISVNLQVETEKLFKEHIIGNKDIKAVVFISSKPDNFIAGADIDMIKAIQDKSTLKEICAKGHQLFDNLRKVCLHDELLLFIKIPWIKISLLSS